MEHFYETVPGWFNFQATYDLMLEKAPPVAHFVEVGAWKGRSAAYMAVNIINSGKSIRFDVVDTWLGSGAEHDHDQDLKDGRLYEVFLEHVAPVLDHINPVRATSAEAAAGYEDASLDLVFIDAAHDYDSVCSDIRAWLPKVKPGGYIGGDDHAHEPVSRAVLDCLGNAYTIETIGTSWPSWLVCKST